MATKHLLPCACGKSVLVEARQAGQTVACECGRSVVVPTLREVRDLPAAEPASDTASRSLRWGARQRVALIGVVIILLSGALLAFFILVTRPELPPAIQEPDLIVQDVERLTLADTFVLWARLQQDSLARQHPELLLYHQKLLEFRIRIGVTGVFVAAGVLTLLSSLFIPAPIPSPSGRGPE